MDTTTEEREPRTTSGSIALVNLHAQIESLGTGANATSGSGRLDSRTAAENRLGLIDLLVLRGHLLSRIADYDQATESADHLVHEAPHEAAAWLGRARSRSAFHRFDEALEDLDAAELNGLHRPTLDAERAVIHQALGDHDRAEALYARAAPHQPDFAALGSSAVLHGERGNIAEAERLFTAARRRYRATSPFPLASLDFRRALMWLRAGDLPTARVWLEASRRRVPAYAPVLAALADLDLASGAYDAAITRLSPLTSSSDDPAYAATLARALNAVGRLREAEQLRADAVARYEHLALRHPEAYAGHAADFIGLDPVPHIH
jgi:tetratricopeptide (TPR) repeat protein